MAAALIASGVFVSAQQPVPTAPTLAAGMRVPTTVLPGIKSGLLTTIQGNALTATNGALPDSLVRLRDARFGRIVATQTTDKSGLFAFKVIDPGSYVIEIIGPDQTAVMGASQLIHVSAGEAVSAVVKLPFKIPPFAGLLGNTAPQITAVTASAATSGVLTTVITTQEPVSP
jgi:hypothetical protein